MRISEIMCRCITKECKEVTLVTHKSYPVFHADEVSATALLQIVFDKLGVKTKLVKTFSPEKEGFCFETEDTIIYDIGLGLYDHHQTDVKHYQRNDGGKYSSVGLIWQEIGEDIVQNKKDTMYESLFKYIDDQDNGNGINPLSMAISAMNVYNGTEEQQDKAFNNAVEMMKGIINSYIARYKAEEAEEEEVNNIIANNQKNYVVTDKYYPSMLSKLAQKEIPFYAYPNIRDGGYCFRTVTPVGGEIGEYIKPIPDEVRNWEGVTFLHPTCFLGSAVSKERAIEIIEKILN